MLILAKGENKLTIRDAGIADLVSKIEREWLGNKDPLKHQAGFCSQWVLDNTCKYIFTLLVCYYCKLYRETTASS